MKLLDTGSTTWFITRESDGSIVWSLTIAGQNHSAYVKRGNAKSENDAKSQVLTAISEHLMRKRNLKK
jgi:hypothetical protein